MRRHPPSAARDQAGFVLVAVLAMLVILSLLAGTIGAVTQRLRDDELQRQRQLEDEIAMASTRATVLYLLLTQRMTFAGLTVDDQVVLSVDQQVEARGGNEPIGIMPVGNEIALDGSPQQAPGGIRFSLQDDRGLVSVNWAGDGIRQALLEHVTGQAPLPTSMETLASTLLDYQDADSLYRLNSAEEAQYRDAGLPPPTNHALTTPLEVRRVMGWRDLLAPVSDLQLVDALTVARSPVLNINTAPATVLASLPGVTEAMAEQAVAARRVQPFSQRSAFFSLIGAIPVGEESVSLYPSPSGTLKLWPSRGGEVQVLHWTLTPLDDGGRPWREDYEFILPQDPELAGRMAQPVAAAVFAEPETPPD